MLLFICMTKKENLKSSWFQYITCYSLSLNGFANAGDLSEFQYITCYSLSFWHHPINRFSVPFQYITCYSLSNARSRDPTEKTKFQYITCYSLSTLSILFTLLSHVSIHHMLLFIKILLQLIPLA